MQVNGITGLPSGDQPLQAKLLLEMHGEPLPFQCLLVQENIRIQVGVDPGKESNSHTPHVSWLRLGSRSNPQSMSDLKYGKSGYQVPPRLLA